MITVGIKCYKTSSGDGSLLVKDLRNFENLGVSGFSTFLLTIRVVRRSDSVNISCGKKPLSITDFVKKY